ncbi:MAG: hypothetical protein OEW58_02765 [Gammaproteobacteria bacterium]|nr:hypothetical protein [Gammaproteobacteria bacterium]
MAEHQMRTRLAHEAARIMAEEGVGDYGQAKRKAAQRLHQPTTEDLPSNQEIERALRKYQSLFRLEQPGHLQVLRKEALHAMRFFKRFSPVLVGPVADGNAGKFSEIILHLFADTTEEVTIFLINNDIPFDQTHVTLNIAGKGKISFPSFEFMAGDAPVALVVMPVSTQRATLRSVVDGKPVVRLDTKRLQELLVA